MNPIDWPKVIGWMLILAVCAAFWVFVAKSAAQAKPAPGWEPPHMEAVYETSAMQGWPHSPTHRETMAVLRRVDRLVLRRAGAFDSLVVCQFAETMARSFCGVVITRRGPDERYRLDVRVWPDGRYRISRRFTTIGGR